MYINKAYELSKEEIESKITDKTKVVGITHVSNVLGTINNVKEIIKYAHKKGAVVIVDASQSIPHMKIDVQELDTDFLVFSGHKMFAPLGIGVLYGKKELLNKMTPFLIGGDMIEYVYEQNTTFAPLPNKFEAGTQNVEGVIGLGSAIDYIEKIGYKEIQNVEEAITKYAVNELSKLDFLELYITPHLENHSTVISFNIKGVHPHDVASILDSNGVCVRSGNHCAQPLLRYLGMDSTCRASFSIYNTKEDVDNLVEALKKAYKMFEKYINKE
jgi:cysteine desulfurase/selenocysteine lyase